MKNPLLVTGVLVIGLALNTIAQTTPAPTPSPNTPPPTTKPAPKVNKRMENQHDRIQQGVRSGELTKKEANNLRKDEKQIHTEVKAERQANGGKLTPEERKQINRQQNQESRKIYNKKHNEAERPRAK